MNIWQIDFYYHPSPSGNDKQWELVICDRSVVSPRQQPKPIYTAQCPASDANAAWLEQQILLAAKERLPDKIQIFRPQSLGLISLVAEKLKIPVEATRNTEALKQVLSQKFQNNPNYNPLALEKPPPQPLPENLWGDEWQIANIAAGQIIDLFHDRPIPISSIPEEFYPINLNLTSDVFIPGIVVYGGRKSMQLASWIEQQVPAFINYIPTEVGKSGGFILETGLVDRWIFNTFESELAAEIARKYEQNRQASQGLHFLLIQPDNSGMTTTAFWLLKEPHNFFSKKQ
ncbi:MAG: Tab2/Atab2 family RNA-binding protein [Cyanobacteria bacterium P01_A01_bin.40]